MDEVKSVTHLGAVWAELLDQDKIWRDSKGDVWKLEVMSPAHHLNLRGFILRRLTSIRLAVNLAELDGLAGPLANLAEGEHLDAGLDREWIQTDLQWIHQKPLYVRLLQLILTDEDGIDRDRIHRDDLDRL